MTVKNLKIMFENMNKLPIDPSILTSIMESDNIPNEFFCCISQDIMTDPVKTIDGHTYDRSSIERWFQEKGTSPLTGLMLTSKGLIPNSVLKEQIEEFTRQKIEAKTTVVPVATASTSTSTIINAVNNIAISSEN